MGSKDTAWPPAGVRDLKPDVSVSDKADHVRFATVREALERATTLTPAMLTEQRVRDMLHHNRGSRVVEYLCRAYLQFGSKAMSAADLQRLCEAINKLGKKRAP